LRAASVPDIGILLKRACRAIVPRIKICFYATEGTISRQIAVNLEVEISHVAGRILFSGASGMLGTALRNSLSAEFETLQLVRRQPNTSAEIEWHPESTPPCVQTSALEGLIAAIHLSGANIAGGRWTPAYKHQLVESRVGSTQALAQVLAQLSHPPEVLLVASGTGFYGDRGDAPVDESAGPGTGFLADLCRAWEEAAEPAAAAGIRAVHLRCGPVLGGGGGPLGKMLPIFRLGLGGPLGNGRQWMSWVALADLIVAVRFLLSGTKLAGPINMVAPEPVTSAEFARAIGRAVRRPAILPAPAFALRLAFGEMADEVLLASARVVPKRLLDAGFPFSYPRIDEALREALA
jgi:uncharacterized protein